MTDNAELWEIMIKKEQILGELVVWLKAKGLWEEAKKDLSITITGEESGKA